MRSIIVCAALIILAMNSVSATSNQLDTCLKAVKTKTQETLQPVEFGLQKNWIDVAKNLFEAGADVIQSYEDCREVKYLDISEWIGFNAS